MGFAGWVAAAIGLAMSASVSAAQTRDVTGTVTDAGTKEPLIGAAVTVTGRAGGTVTNNKGVFRLAVPTTGEVVITVRFIGYLRREVRLAPGESSVEVALQRDALKLEGVTITGAATSVDRRNAATAVSVVNSEDLTRTPATSLEAQLQGKLVGANINMNSGAPGGGAQIQIRGPTSVLGRADPLFVIDGVLIDNTGTSTGINSITGASGRNTNITNSSQDNQVNRLADINPNDIENLQVLKGAAASAIYGAKATNGVIVITTKRGRAGVTRYNFLQRVGMNELQRSLGQRRFPSREAALAAAGTNPDAIARTNAAFDANPSPYFDNVAKLYDQRDLAYESVGSVSGGTDATRYFLTGTYKYEPGTQRRTDATLQTLRVNLDQTISPKWTAQLSTAFSRNEANRGLSGNDNAQTSPLYVLGFTPGVLDLDVRDAAGNYVTNPFAGGGNRISNPFQTINAIENRDATDRFIGSGTLKWAAYTSARNSVQLSAIGGVDRYNQDLVSYLPNYIQNEGADGFRGRSIQGSGESSLLNTSLNAVWTYTPANGWFESTTSAGLQAEQRYNNTFYVRARGLLPGTDYVNQGNQQTAQTRVEVRDQAAYAQQQLVIKDRWLIGGRIRGERSSVNGDRSKLYYFPALSTSYRLEKPLPMVDEFKVRAAIGTSGNQPRYGDRDLTFNALGIVGGQNAVGTATQLGNPAIKPEKMTENEYGVDASFLNKRLSLEATYFDRSITDLLLAAPLSPTSGIGTQVINGGKLRTDGYEVAVTALPIDRPGFSWNSTVSYYTYKSVVETSAVPPFNVPNSGFGAEYGRARWVEGYRSTLIWGNRKRADGTTVDSVVADAAPEYTMGFANRFDVGRLSMNVVVDYRKGGYVSNMTQATWDDGQNSWDYDKKAPNGDPRPLGLYRSQERTRGNTGIIIQDGSYVKLREVTLTFDAPKRWASLVPRASSLRVSASGRNLFTSTTYWGLDPEVSNFGNQNISRFVDLTIYPPSRSFFFSVDLGF